MPTTIGTNAGNKSTFTAISLGIGTGTNQSVKNIYVGTAAGNKQVYSAFTGYTEFFGPGSGTVTVPSGATSARIVVCGSGGGGGNGASSAGGGGAGTAIITISVVAGQTFNYFIPNATAAATDGTAATVNTWTGGSLSLTANGGKRGGGLNSPGAGGTATGGTTNISGNPGNVGFFDPEGGISYPGTGGACAFGNEFGNGGTGFGNSGNAGRLQVDWS